MAAVCDAQGSPGFSARPPILPRDDSQRDPSSPGDRDELSPPRGPCFPPSPLHSPSSPLLLQEATSPPKSAPLPQARLSGGPEQTRGQYESGTRCWAFRPRHTHRAGDINKHVLGQFRPKPVGCCTVLEMPNLESQRKYFVPSIKCTYTLLNLEKSKGYLYCN